MYPKFKDKYTPKSSIHSKTVEEMKALLKAQQLFFYQTTGKKASFCVSYLLAKHRAFKTYTLEKNIPLQKLVSFKTDRAPAMHGLNAGSIALCRKDPAIPSFVNYVIHQQVLASKVLDFSHVMTVVVKIVNSIHSKALQHHLFKSQLKSRNLSHFQKLANMVSNILDSFHPEEFCVHLDRLAEEFNRQFQELNHIEDIVTFISNPFLATEIEDLSAKFQQYFMFPSGVDMIIIDLEMKGRSRDKVFWWLVNSERYPLLSSCALKVKAFFGSTYICEMTFSQMKIVKSKYHTCLTDSTKRLQIVCSHRHVTDC
ncbi:GTD2B protein, partial [Atractosteus spatula]|nr:GTD2B protein [Atractosteus spatula]